MRASVASCATRAKTGPQQNGVTDKNSVQNTETKKGSNRRKKATIAGGATALAAAVLLGGGTLAAWNDAERVELEAEAGHFEIEISTDQDENGEWTNWQSGTVDGAPAELDITSVVQDDVGGTTFRPGDEYSVDFALRSAEPTTHNGILEYYGIDWYITEGQGGFELEVSNSNNILRADGPVIEGEDLEFASGFALLPADQSHVDMTATLSTNDDLELSELAAGTVTFTPELDDPPSRLMRDGDVYIDEDGNEAVWGED